MSYQPFAGFYLTCTVCGNNLDDGDGYAIRESKDALREYAEGQDWWIEGEDDHICYICRNRNAKASEAGEPPLFRCDVYIPVDIRVISPPEIKYCNRCWRTHDAKA